MASERTAELTASAASARDPLPVLQRVKGAAQELGEALNAVLSAVTPLSAGPQELTRELGINRALAGRLLSALKLNDPLASVNRLPRSEGLRIFLKAAKSRAERPKIERAHRALQDFEQLVRAEFGGWAALDPVVSEWLPDVRSKFETANKQGAFRCLSNLRGVQADVELTLTILYPDPTGQRCDIASVTGLGGLHRLRPSARICFATIGATLPKHARETISVAGVGKTGPEEFPLLEDFCSAPIPKFEVWHTGNAVNYMLEGRALGPDASVSLFAACVARGVQPRYRSEPSRLIGPLTGLNVPAKVLLFYMLVHDDICPGQDPELRIYDTARMGHVDPNNPASEVDRLHMVETVQSLGKGVAALRASELASVAEMTAYVCERLGWDTERLRGYRCRVQYPLYGGQYCLLLDPPPAPAG